MKSIFLILTPRDNAVLQNRREEIKGNVKLYRVGPWKKRRRRGWRKLFTFSRQDEEQTRNHIARDISGTLTDRKLLWLHVLVQPVERLSFYSQGTQSHTVHSASPKPTETWPASLTWCWSSSSADQDGSLYILEDNKAPSVTGLRQPVYAVAGPRPLPRNAHSPTPAARTQTSSQYTQTKPGLAGSWSRPTFFQAAISHAPWPAQYPQPHLQSNCLPDLLSYSPATLAWSLPANSTHTWSSAVP